ncbi:galactose-1-phosphate uridylyltransferase [Streptomyces sp. NPDC058662]|uniref:galactose-1-phosphate uridylyltransferase n=1 Tax=Streptomyces sp. NPDC058662 TaxID=3346583 RepID=UPI00364C82F4
MTRTHRISATLPDGRSIHYYDEQPGRVRPSAPAAPPAAPVPSTLRWDATTEDWVLMAPHRAARTALGPHCPLCASSPPEVTEIPGGAYDVAVFDNRFPALGGPGGPPVGGDRALLASAPAPGRCEVVSFSSDHDTPLARLPLARVRTVVDAWADRTRELNRMAAVEQVVCFENRGAEVGASLSHPHGQIYAYPWMPERFRRMHESARSAGLRGESCVFCRVRQAEEEAGSRVVARTAHWSAFVPFAARWPYEVHLYARRHVPDLDALTDEERDDLARIYRSLLHRFESVADAPLPYMAVWMQAAARRERHLAHVRAQVFSGHRSPTVVKRPAAGELGAGAFVSEASPERAAEALRAADPAWKHEKVSA